MTTTSKGSLGAMTTVTAAWDQRVVVKVKHIIGTIFVLFIVFGLLTWQNTARSEASRQDDLRGASEAAYRAEVVAFQVVDYQIEVCMARIDSRVVNRERFMASNLAMRAIIDTYSPKPPRDVDQVVYKILDDELQNIIDNVPLLDESICPVLPDPPIPPEGLEP